MSEPVKPFFFLHIPKSAGSTFQSIINGQYRFKKAFNFFGRKEIEKWRALSDEEKNKYVVLKGHFNFEGPDFYPGKCTYFTFLRDPAKRIISHYNYIYSLETHRLHKEMLEKKYSLKEMLQNGKVLELDNCMVRKLSGNNRKGWDELNEEDLKLALHNFDTYFEHFGLVEKFDESLIIMTYELGWKTPYYYTLNETKDRKENFDSETFQLLEHFSRFDKMLWQHAQKKFELKLEKYKDKIDKDVEAFRKKNAKQAVFRRLFYKLMRVKNVK